MPAFLEMVMELSKLESSQGCLVAGDLFLPTILVRGDRPRSSYLEIKWCPSSFYRVAGVTHVEALATGVFAWTPTPDLQLEGRGETIMAGENSSGQASQCRPQPATEGLLPHPSRSTIRSTPPPGSIVIAHSARSAHNP